MVDVVDKIENAHIREWFRKNVQTRVLENIVNQFTKQGYELDPQTGLMFRDLFPEKILQELGSTVVDIVFTRPTDVHYHEDVNEAVYVLSGKGIFYMKGGSPATRRLYSGCWAYVPVNAEHGFKPTNRFLEIRLNCSGILDPEKEVIKHRFDKFPYFDDF